MNTDSSATGKCRSAEAYDPGSIGQHLPQGKDPEPGTILRNADGASVLVGIDGETFEVPPTRQDWIDEEADPSRCTILRIKPGEAWKFRFLPTLNKDIPNGRTLWHEWYGESRMVGDTWFPKLKVPCYRFSATHDDENSGCPICEVRSKLGLDKFDDGLEIRHKWFLPVVAVSVRHRVSEVWDPPPSWCMNRIITLDAPGSILAGVLEVAKRLHGDKDDLLTALTRLGNLENGECIVIERDERGIFSVAPGELSPISRDQSEHFKRLRNLFTLQKPAPLLRASKAEEIGVTLDAWKSGNGQRERNFQRADRILQLFAPARVVLIPQHYGTKLPVRSGYLEHGKLWMKAGRDYLEVLSFSNIAVLLGPESDNVVSVDLDSSAYVDAFFQSNPWAQRAQFSQGGRGGNVWLKMRGDYPTRVSHIMFGGERVGEFRGGNGLTTISGLHKSGKSYTITNGGTIPEVAFKDIVWPEGWVLNAPARIRRQNYSDDDIGYCILNTSLLKNPHQGRDGSVDYQCPACAEAGSDKSTNHLRIFSSGAYVCIVDQSEEHKARIRELAGRNYSFDHDEECVAGDEGVAEQFDVVEGSAPDDTPSPESGNKVHPEKWFANRFPSVAEEFGKATRVERSEKEGRCTFSFRALNEDFFANLLGECGSPDSPVIYADDEDEFYAYSKKEGIFQRVKPAELETRITAIMRECANYYAKVPGVNTDGLTYNLGKHRVLDGVIAKAKAYLKKTAASYFAGPSRNFIPCANGLLDLSTWKFQPFSPTMRLRSKLPVSYAPEADCQTFCSFINGFVTNDDDQAVLQQYLGQCLVGRNWSQRLLILQGEGGIGKGTLGRVLRGIIGAENFIGLRVTQLGEKFEISRLRGKWVAYDGDAPHTLLSNKSSYLLKGLTGGDLMGGERKNSNNDESQEMAVNIICYTNMRLLINLNGDESAWGRRLVYMPLESETPKEPEAFLDEKLLEEKSGILNWMLTGLRQLIDAKWNIRLSDRQKQIIDCLLIESSSVTSFVRECVVPDRDGDLAVADALQAYTAYCASRGWQSLAKRKFEQQLDKAMLREHQVSKANNIVRLGKDKRGWNRVSLRPEWERHLTNEFD